MPKETFYNLTVEKRERIIDAAITEFGSKHYKKVTIDGLVREAAIPKGSFYQYFKNKDDVYIYIFGEIGNSKKDSLGLLAGEVTDLSLKEYLYKMLVRARDFEEQDGKLLALKERFMKECPQEVRKSVLKNELPKSYGLLEEVLRAYIKKGELRADLPVKVTAYALTTCLTHLEDYPMDEGEGMETVIDAVFDVIINGSK